MNFEFVGRSRRDPDSTQANPARLVNMYREPMGEGYNLKRVLGMVPFRTLPGVPTRGVVEIAGTLYAVNAGTLYSVAIDGVLTSLGVVADGDDTTISSNNGSICVAANGVLHVWNGADMVAPDTGAFSDVGSVTFWGQRTILSEKDGRRVQWSAVANASSYDALDFATAEARDDNIVRIMNLQGQLWVFGEKSIERWYLTGGTDFARPISGALLDIGLKALHLAAEIPNGGFFIGSDNIAYMTSGGAVRPVSTRGVETNIQAGTATHVFYYEDEGHKFCVIRYGDRPADVYDVVSDEWHERGSDVDLQAWLAIASVKAYGSWIVATEAGMLFALERVNKDGVTPLVGEAVSRNLISDGNYFSIDRVTLWTSTGQTFLGRETAAGLAFDPGFLLGVDTDAGLKIRDMAAAPRPGQIMVQFSRDRGETWGKERWVSLGDLGDYRKRVRVNGLGLFEAATMRIRVSDPDEITIEAACSVEAG